MTPAECQRAAAELALENHRTLATRPRAGGGVHVLGCNSDAYHEFSVDAQGRRLGGGRVTPIQHAHGVHERWRGYRVEWPS